MKRIFTFLTMTTLVCTGVDSFANKTTVLQEDFESVTKPALPSNWTQQTAAATGWKTNSGAISFPNTNNWMIPAHTNYAVVDDWNSNEDNDSTVLVSPTMDMTAITGAVLTFDYYFIGAYYTGGTPIESAYLKVTTDGGNSWDYIDTLKGMSNTWQTLFIDLSAYDNESSVQIGFEYFDGGNTTKPLFGLGLDNIQVFVPSALDISVNTVNLPVLYDTNKIAIKGTPVKVNVTNFGTDTVKTIDMEFAIDAGTPVAESFTGLSIPPFTSTDLSFTGTLPTITAAQHDISVKATMVNSNPDGYTANNEKVSNFIGASNSTTRNCLIEEFTSSTCVPCAYFNSTFDPLIVSNDVNKPESHFNIVKYQMNWPSPGNDPSYNPHGATRRGYYGVNSIPHHFTNGHEGGAGDQAEINECKGGDAFVKIDGKFFVDEDSFWTDVNVTPYFNLTRDYKVYMAVVERGYDYQKAATTQKKYVAVMRRMLPSASGTTLNTLVDNTSTNYKYNAPAPYGDPQQGNYELWVHPKNTDLVVFVQDNASGVILQSVVLPSEWPTSIEETNSFIKELAVYPNPAMDMTKVGFNIDKATDVSIQVTDAVGRVVYTVTNKLDAGFNELTINTSDFAAGLYNVRLQAENTSIVKRLSVVR